MGLEQDDARNSSNVVHLHRSADVAAADRHIVTPSAEDEELEFRLLLLVDRERERVLLYKALLVIELIFGLFLVRELLFWLL
jgi:hypothetical protein